MFKKLLTVVMLLLISAAGYTQSAERAIGSIRKKRWLKAQDQLIKAIKKDSLDPAAYYAYAFFYFSPDNPAYHIDSAYKFTSQSLRIYAKLTPREQEKLKRFPLDTTILAHLRSRIDSAGFERARQINQEEAYIRFLEQFPTAIQREEATRLRDEAAYQDAYKISSYQSFLSFLEKYPAATRAPEARTQYNRLVFEAKTQDKKLSSYMRFMDEHPGTPYRYEVEKNIFELYTVGGDVESFQAFMRHYPKSAFSKQARDIVFHLEMEQEVHQWSPGLLTDSLNEILKLRETYLVPAFIDNRYGFMDKTGMMVLTPAYYTIAEDYLCGNIQEDLLVVDGKIISRNGAVVFRDSVSEIEDIGYGFILVRSGHCRKIIHKSGFVIGQCMDDARVLAGQYLALQKDGKWALHSLAGRMLTGFDWLDITAATDMLIFRNEQGSWLVPARSVVQLRERSNISFTRVYDEAKPWPGGMLWVRSGEQQALLDQTLQEIIPSGKHVITQSAFGAIAETDGHVQLLFKNGKLMSFKALRFQEPWIVVKQDSLWQILNAEIQSTSAPYYDSTWFQGPFLIASAGDSITVHFNKNTHRTFSNLVKIGFIAGKSTEAFVLVRKGQKGTLYNEKGNPVFATEYENLQYAGDGFFIVSKQEKKGLLNASGKLVLPIEFDAIGNVANHVISLLKKMKFGAYHTLHKQLLKPQFDKNVILYNDKVVAVYRKGTYTFATWENKPVGTLEFSEIRKWNDTTAFVKQKNSWTLYHLNSKKVIVENIKDLRLIKDTPEEQVAIIQQDNAFGVISNTRGYVIPGTFSNIINLGSAEEPLYFTEKHVEEADIYVVIYYNNDGKLIRRQVFETPEDYEKIYCSDN